MSSRDVNYWVNIDQVSSYDGFLFEIFMHIQCGIVDKCADCFEMNDSE